MYLFKNAFINIKRNIGRNILIGIMFTVVIICSCIGLSIYKASNNLVDSYIKSNPLEVSLRIQMQEIRSASDEDKTSFQSLTVDEIKKYADSDYVKDYYYTLETSLSSSTINPISSDLSRPDSSETEEETTDDKVFIEKGSFGSFRLTAYSNFAYLSDFESGNKKIKEGSMITENSAKNEIVISESLADENELSIGDEVTFTLPSDEEKTFTYKIIGIYEEQVEDTSNNFMNAEALNSANQMYGNVECVNELLNSIDTDDTKIFRNDGLDAKFYLNNNDDLEAFEKEVKSKGLSDYYQVLTNEDEITKTLDPIKNLSTFSVNFLIVIFIIGFIIISVLVLLNIRNRKYEIGVLRAIGMNKFKVTMQFVLEIFIIALISLVIGTTSGILSSQPITNKMLAKEIASYQEQKENVNNNFGGDGFERPSNTTGSNNRGGGRVNNQNIDYVDQLKVTIDFTTIIQLCLVVITLTISSVVIASTFVNKYNPNKILQNRN